MRELRPWHDKCVCPSPCEPHGTLRESRKALPDEVTIGPFIFEWDKEGMQICRGEEAVGYIEHVYEDVWRAFLQEAKPYYGPG